MFKIDKSSLKNKPSEVTVVPPVLKDLLVWQAPVRPFKKRSKEYFSTITAIGFLLIIILLFVKEFLLALLVIAVIFFTFALAKVEPPLATYKLTTRGVVIGEKIYKWEDFSRFWLGEKWGQKLIYFETLYLFPRQITVLLGKNKEEEVKKIIEKYLIYEKPSPNFMDKLVNWLEKKFPMEEKN